MLLERSSERSPRPTGRFLGDWSSNTLFDVVLITTHIFVPGFPVSSAKLGGDSAREHRSDVGAGPEDGASAGERDQGVLRAAITARGRALA